MAGEMRLTAVVPILAALGGLSACQTSRPPALSAKGPLIQSAATCADFSQTVYFGDRQAVITREADGLLTLAAAKARGCAVTGVDVVGLADAKGDTAENLALSQRRADAVKAALHRHGFTAVEIKVAAAGDAGAQTATGQDRPVRRRADLTFRLAPAPAKGS